MNDEIVSSPPLKTTKKTNILLRIWRGIASVFRFLRVSVANILLIILIIVIFAFLFSGPAVKVEPNSVLVFSPSQSLVEKRQNVNPMFDFLLGSAGAEVTDVHELVATIRHASKNPRILALEIRPDSLAGVSLVHLNMIGEALKTFSESGKPIYAYSDEFSQSAYLLSSFADVVYMNEFGAVNFSGFAFETMYYKSILEKLDITVNIFRSGEYKSAVEPYLLDAMSDIVRESYRPIVDQMWGATKDLISTNRGLEPSSVSQFTESIADLLEPGQKTLGELAAEHKFVDQLITSNSLQSKVSQEFGLDRLNESSARISTEDYFRTIEDHRDVRITAETADSDTTLTKRGGRIAVITVEGPIFGWSSEDGAQLVDSTGAVEHLQHAISEMVDAVVLRVNSPGGSVLASEAIRLQVKEVKELGIPVVVSMANTAASGGYWIAADADRILASDTTITGSIGVFSMMPSVEKLLERVGVNIDGVYSSEGHFRVDPMSGISESEAKVLQASVDDAYDTFLEVVSTGRNMPKDEVAAVASGRIWTGIQALERGLVDSLGGYDDALEVAANLAGLKSYVVERYGFVRRPPFMNLLSQASNWTPQISPESQQFLRHARNTWLEVKDQLAIKPRTVYALCEFCPDF